MSGDEDNFLLRFPDAARIIVEDSPTPPLKGSPPPAPRRTRLAMAELLIARERSMGIVRADCDVFLEAGFGSASEYWSDATAGVTDESSFVHTLAIHFLGPDLPYSDFYEPELRDALDIARENGELWFIDVPDKERRLRPREAAAYLLSQPTKEHLVPSGLKAFLQSEVQTAPRQRRRSSPPKTDPMIEKMRKMDRAALKSLTQKEMAARFGAARSTCENARKKVLSESI